MPFTTEKDLRNWVLHLNSRMIRRGRTYSLYMKDAFGRPCDRVDFKKLSEIEPWLLEWSDKQIALLKNIPAKGAARVSAAQRILDKHNSTVTLQVTGKDRAPRKIAIPITTEQR